ncbi:MAG: site-specific integrase [Pseudomonadales bacterium]|nr:site-specific integrase [Pseudomonadales bacterium]
MNASVRPVGCSDQPLGGSPDLATPTVAGSAGLHLHIQLDERMVRMAVRLLSRLSRRKAGKPSRARQTQGMDAAAPAPTRGALAPADAALKSLVQDYRDEHGDLTAQHHAALYSLLRDLLEHAQAADPGLITRTHIVKFLAWCEEVGRPHRLADGTITRRRKPAGARSRRTYLSTLTAFFDWAIRAEKMRPPNPCQTIRAPKAHRKQGRAFKPAEAVALIAAAPFDRSVLYELLYVGGPRIGVVAGTRYRKPLPDAYFHLDANPPHIEVPPEWGKGGRAYTVALSEALAARLLELRAGLGADHTPSLPLFTKRPSWKTFRADCRRAGVALRDTRDRSAGLHCFRRGAATSILDLGFDAKVAQNQLGHADVSTTLRDYTDRGVDDQAAAAEALQAVVNAAVENRAGAGKSLDGRGRCADNGGATLPMLPPLAIPRAAESRRALCREASQQTCAVARPGSATQAGKNPQRTPAAIAASVIEWAILDSNQYARSGDTSIRTDLPPRAAGIVHHALRVLEIVLRCSRGAQGAPTDVVPPAPAPNGHAHD